MDHPIPALVTYPYPVPDSFVANPFPGAAFEPYLALGMETATPQSEITCPGTRHMAAWIDMFTRRGDFVAVGKWAGRRLRVAM